MNISRLQVDATIARFQKRVAQRSRNENLIQQGRLLDVDTPQRVEKWLKRHGVSSTDAASILSDREVGVPSAPAWIDGRHELDANVKYSPTRGEHPWKLEPLSPTRGEHLHRWLP